LGAHTTKKVQDKVIAMLFTWSVALTEQVKIRDAYQMLKKQGNFHSIDLSVYHIQI